MDKLTGRNEHYGYLNVRFDRRAKALLALGFIYEGIPAYGIAVFVLRKYGKVHTVQTGTVTNADDVVWQDTYDSARSFSEFSF